MGTKGDWKRPTDKRYADPDIVNTHDYGSLGCKRGFHTVYPKDGFCFYCKKSEEDINNE